MFERKVLDPSIMKVDFHAAANFVYVSKFESETIKEFVKACEIVLNSGQKFLPLVVDSFGGQVYTLFGMLDFLNNCGTKVVTICEGKAMSAGAVLFSCGSERYAGELSTIMVHEVSSFNFGKDADIQNDAQHTSKLNQKLFNILDKNTGQSKGYWLDLLHKQKNTDLYLTAEQSKKHGLATHVGIPYIETTVSVEKKLILP